MPKATTPKMPKTPKKSAAKHAHPASPSHRRTQAKRTPTQAGIATHGTSSRTDPIDTSNADVEREGRSGPERRSEERIADSTSIER